MPTEAAERLKQYVDTGRLEQAAPAVEGEATGSQSAAGIRLAAQR
jgi:hypothetical protein